MDMSLKDARDFVVKNFPKEFLDKIFLKINRETIKTEFCSRSVWQTFSMGKSFASIYKDNNIQIYLLFEYGQLVVVYDSPNTYYDLGLDKITGYDCLGYTLTQEEAKCVIEDLNNNWYS